MVPKSSITGKIVGLTLAVSGCMLSVTLWNYLRLERFDAELELLSATVVPLNGLVSDTEARSLEQAVLFERVLRSYETGTADPAESDTRIARLESLGVEVDANLAAARRLLSAGIATAPLTEDSLELARMESALAMLEKEHQEYQDHALALLREERDGDRARVAFLMPLVEAEQDDLDASLVDLMHRLAALSEREARETFEGEDMIHQAGLAVSLVVFLLGAISAPRISRRLVKPLREMIQSANQIASGDLDVEVPVQSSDEVGQLAEAFGTMAEELRRKERLKETFGKYLDPRIVEGLLEEGKLPEVNESRKQVMTVFFSDVAKFSSIAEALTPVALVRLINRYFTLASEPIAEQKGVIDKLIGDAIMAFWGPPFTSEHDHAEHACTAALAQREKLEELRPMIPELVGFRKDVPRVDVRIGLCTGELVVGSIGSNTSKSYTVMGDTVNIAARLEGANKHYGTRILMAEETQRRVAGKFETRKIDNLVVVGKIEPIYVFELLARSGELEAPQARLRDAYEDALGHYFEQRWDAADASLAVCQAIDPEDGPTRVLAERTAVFRESPPGAGWDGVWHMRSK